jgi:hypothetical protein
MSKIDHEGTESVEMNQIDYDCVEYSEELFSSD